MKQFLLDLLDERTHLSSMRFMAIISLLIGGIIAGIGMYKCTDLSGTTMLVGVFVGAAFTGKVMQKNTEIKEETHNENIT